MASPLQLLGSARWALLLGAAFACAACGSDADAGGSGGGGGTGGVTAGPNSLSFVPSNTLTLVPGEKRTLTVAATPPGQYPVRLALLGDYDDASLDKSETVTDPDGRATVTVMAPSSARAFSLRASSGEKVTANVAVSVSASGFGSLKVSPEYSGKRDVSYWLASVRTGVTCADLSGDLLKDGDLKASAPSPGIPQVDDVPVGPTLAVTLRGAESIVGCEEMTDLGAGKVKELKVTVVDIPIKLEDTQLDVVLGLDAGKAKWSDLLPVDAMLVALSPASNDASALLDAMQAATTDAAQATGFQTARKTGGWDAVVQTAIGGPNTIRSTLEPWLTQGAEGFASPDALRGRLSNAHGNASSAWFELESIGGADAFEAGAPTTYLASWKPHPDDTVALGVALTLLPSRLVASLALAPAKAKVPTASSVPQALAQVVGCQTVAQALVAAGSGPAVAFPGCDAACAQALCRDGLALLWSHARDASAAPAAPSASLTVAAAAQATVDDFARPSALSGSWVGTFSSGNSSAAVTGSASAKTPAPE